MPQRQVALFLLATIHLRLGFPSSVVAQFPPTRVGTLRRGGTKSWAHSSSEPFSRAMYLDQVALPRFWFASVCRSKPPAVVVEIFCRRSSCYAQPQKSHVRIAYVLVSSTATCLNIFFEFASCGQPGVFHAKVPHSTHPPPVLHNTRSSSRLSSWTRPRRMLEMLLVLVLRLSALFSTWAGTWVENSAYG